MSANLEKLKAILREMFQLDQAELDFGIYRIMNQKRDEIEKFLDKDLLPQVQTAFSEYGSTAKASLQEELDKMKAEIERLGYVAEDNPRYQEKKAALVNAVDVTALENEVFSYLANFFRRYYQGGDFLSLRRYKAGVYAIPYEGEEVKLHWANADQYYIKSTENFRDYTFRLPSGKHVHFKLVEATSETNDQKEQKGKERRFTLHTENTVAEKDGQLIILFQYQIFVAEDSTASEEVQSDEAEGNKKKKIPTQEILNKASLEAILATAPLEWQRDFSVLAPTEKNPRRTLLEKHLNDYTSKYSFDYFIHKDLGGFLRRELDFFMKNEVLFIDDLDAENVQKSLSKAKVIKGVAHKVIAFLEQLENFQKKLWLKKKFVVNAQYCVTLDLVPEDLYSAVLQNKCQVEEWKRLFAIDEIEGDLHTPRFVEPLTLEFLKANPYLVVDTGLFEQAFTERLLSTFVDVDGAIDGLLVNSDNFQALQLLQSRFTDSVRCTCIDPPYNTGSDGFIYKDNYQHSSWMTMVEKVVLSSKQMLASDCIFASTIDDDEVFSMGLLLNQIFGPGNKAACAPWKSEPSGGKEKTGLRTGHEYVLIYHNGDATAISQDERSTGELNKTDKFGSYRKGRELRKWGGASRREDREGQWFALPTPDGTYVHPIKNDGTQGHWRWGKNNVNIKAALNDSDVFHWEVCKYDNGVTYEGASERWVPFEKIRDIKKSVGWSTWLDSYGANAEGTKALKELFKEKPFDTPKPVSLYEWIISLHGDSELVALDFFAGSGTTGHAVINLNRDDGGSRKYVLIEMGQHFTTVVKPRIQKVIYSKDWKDGKPVSREGTSHIFKYIRLESYEDALNNLQLKKRSAVQQGLLDHHERLREEYMLSYMLDVESQGSHSLLNVEKFKDPFNYQMKIAHGGETKVTTIDLLETFNYLLGIKVLRISAPERRTAEFERDGEGRLQIKGKHRSCAAGEGWTFREVEGTKLDGEKVLVIWRTLTGTAEEDNLMLEAYFSKRNYSTLDFEFSRIYVNGDNNLENLKIGQECWKVALIEEEFKRLMFSVEDV